MTEVNQCTYQYINSQATVNKKCMALGTDCGFTYFDLIKLNFCYFNDQKIATLILALIIIIFCFYFIANTANKYLAPMLGIMSEKMNLSQNLAGLTLIALGNQAPDVLVAIISGEDEEEGISMSLGAVLGSNLLILHIVLSSVVILGNDFEVIPSNYVRDFSVYLFSLIIIFVFGALKQIVLWESIVFFLIYFAYVDLCFFMDKKGEKEYNEVGELNFGGDVTQDCEVKLFQDDIMIVSLQESSLNEFVDEGYVHQNDQRRRTTKKDLKASHSIFFSRFQYGLVSNYLRWSETYEQHKHI